MTEIVVYGISNCDTVKRARAALTAAACEHGFHDFKKAGVPLQDAAQWLTQCGWQALLNRQGTTWRKLSDAEKEAVNDERSALALMQSQPSVIKRPVIRWADGTVTVGWNPTVQARLVRVSA
jgi:Spx/MgsR family transcriptional regulator